MAISDIEIQFTAAKDISHQKFKVIKEILRIGKKGISSVAVLDTIVSNWILLKCKDTMIRCLPNGYIFVRQTEATYNEFSNTESLAQLEEVIDTLIKEFTSRFLDVEKIRHYFVLFEDPMQCAIETHESKIQEELVKIRADLSLPIATGLDFWKHISPSEYPNIKSTVLKLHAMCGTTYICESTFSIMNIIKSKHRNLLSDQHLKDLLIIKTYPDSINIDEVISNQENT